MSSKRNRVDVMLVERGLAPSREKARALLLAGSVYSGEERVDKAGTQLKEDAPLEVRGPVCPYVSRGGLKLEGALRSFGQPNLEGLVAADIGASTGGFTDVLLTQGVTKVFAVDVGYGQLHAKLRSDPRVVVMERTNARYLRKEDLGDAVDLVVIDASFIGLSKLLPAAERILKPQGLVIAMIKPQFEVGRENLGKNGVVRDESLRKQAIEKVAQEATAIGFAEKGRCDCSIRGPKGNLEAFLFLLKGVAPQSAGL